MHYRTKTYIAGDWTGDQDLISELYRMNDSSRWPLHFTDAHQLTQARDTSLPCSIKRSLAVRLDASKTFVLVVGDGTLGLTKGSCQHCKHYWNSLHTCDRGNSHSISLRSFIEYECEKAVRDGLNIVVLYNSTMVDRTKCPEAVRTAGTHLAAYTNYGYGRYLNRTAISDAIM